MPIFLIADVHLSTRRQERLDRFSEFLEWLPNRGGRLYILGDLFDLWLGDDDLSPPHPQVLAALERLTTSGIQTFVMHGNHDFTLGSDFESRTGCRILPDPSIVKFYDTPVLLMHGDTLCTEDMEYQKYRNEFRAPESLRAFLALPLEQRREKADKIKKLSGEAVRNKPMEIMDVSMEEVKSVMRLHGVRHLVHGHTHRPGIHNPNLGGNPATRIVLGDWYTDDSVVRWDEDGYRLLSIAELMGKP